MKKFIYIIVSIVAGVVVFLSARHFEYNPSFLTVELKAEYIEPDRFQLFYAFEENPIFIETNSINYRIKGLKGLQTISFNIPLNGKAIVGLRLDISSANNKQKPIYIESLSIKNNKQSLEYSNNILDAFTLNKYVQYKEGRFFTRMLNNKYDPFLVSKEIGPQIRELTKSKKYISVYLSLFMAIIVAIALYGFGFYSNLGSRIGGDQIVIAVFIMTISLPILLKISNIKESINNLENRKLVEKPEFQFSKSYSSKFETYYNDVFPFRNSLINLSSFLKIHLFKSSPFPEKVQFGSDHFLYLNNIEVKNSYTHSNILSQGDIHKYVITISDRKSRLNKEGIQYYIGYFPNKHSVYPEFLPWSMKSQIKKNFSLADQLQLNLSKHGIKYFNPKKQIITSKTELLYHKFDTHWNNYGAFVTYQAFFQEFKELNINPYSIEDFNVVYKTRFWGDLTRLIGTEKIKGYIETRPLFELKDTINSFTRIADDTLPKGSIRTSNNNCNNTSKVIFFGDSYSTYLVQFFSLHFKEVIYYRGAYNQTFVDKIKPNIIFELSVERFIYKHLSTDISESTNSVH